MDEDRARRIQEIVEKVRSLPPEGRDACLDEACGDDAELRIEVAAVLGRHDEEATQHGTSTEFDDLLKRAAQGDRDASDRFWSLVYDDLQVMARYLLPRRGQRGALPDTGSLVLRAAERLLGGALPDKNRDYFFGAAKLAMKRIICEMLRRQRPLPDTELVTRLKHDFGLSRFDREDIAQALEKLEEALPEPAEVVRLRLFNGLTVKETALAMGNGDRTVEKHWVVARAFLHRELTRGDSEAG